MSLLLALVGAFFGLLALGVVAVWCLRLLLFTCYVLNKWLHLGQ